MSMIEIKNVSKWYGEFQVLKNCSTTVEKGEVVVVCGPSGSGKSTLIKTVNALEPFQQGEILINGINVGDPKTDLPKLRSHVGMVFQHFELFPHLSITARGSHRARAGASGSRRAFEARPEVPRAAFGRSAAACGNCSSSCHGPCVHAL